MQEIRPIKEGSGIKVDGHRFPHPENDKHSGYFAPQVTL
jgi:hypothetical protein